MLAYRVSDDASFTLDIGLESRCLRCRATRDLDEFEGQLLMSGDTTHVIEASTPCPCGERRVKVTLDFD